MPDFDPDASADETVAMALRVAEQAGEEGKKAIVCLCGVYLVSLDQTTCPRCGKPLKNRGL